MGIYFIEPNDIFVRNANTSELILPAGHGVKYLCHHEFGVANPPAFSQDFKILPAREMGIQVEKQYMFSPPPHVGDKIESWR